MLPLEPSARIGGGPPVLDRTILTMMPSSHQRMNRHIGDGKVRATRIRTIPPATINRFRPSTTPLHLRSRARGWQRQDVLALAHRQRLSSGSTRGTQLRLPGPAGRWPGCSRRAGPGARPAHEQDRPHLMEPPGQQDNPEAAEHVPPPFGRAHERNSGVKGLQLITRRSLV